MRNARGFHRDLGRPHGPWVHAELIAAATVTAILATLLAVNPLVSAPQDRPVTFPSDQAMGQCLNPPPSTAIQSGFEHAVVPTTTGAVSRVKTKNPELCHQQQDLISSGSASWVMLTNVSLTDHYFQVGNVKEPGDTCPHYYMEYNGGGGGTRRFDKSGTCTSSSTWYRFDLKKISGVWHARIFLDSTNTVVYDSPQAPTQIPWSIEDAQYASEVQNGGKDQSGGVYTTRLTFDAARWYTSTGTIVWADMQGSERRCNLCAPDGPYHAQWYDGNTFEVWTNDNT